ncbi:hypothetical protein [Clostridium lundense]|uniref:hypothetical protein n=1 Tax=Clostridium lundense TaxID=319475 RepID=UPI000AEE8987|nr:hypothetical protein [Clostridium lundense]
MMSQYKLDINGIINLSDYSSIYDYIDIVGEEDSLTINMNFDNKDDYYIVCNMLKDKGFHIVESKELGNSKYCILASRANKVY